MNARRISAIVAVAALSAAAGCSNHQVIPLQSAPGSGLAVPSNAVSRAGWLSPQGKAGKGLLYVADQPNQRVAIFTQTGTPAGQITDAIAGPDGLYADPNGTLYVANSGPPYMIKLVGGPGQPGSITFDQYESAKPPAIPAGAINLNQLESGSG